MMERKEAEAILQHTFQITNFYDEQWQVIEKIFKGEKVLFIARTGYGKSLCFQFPATIFKGLTVVFTPLISLMRDQVKKLNSLNIPANCINSEQSDEENNKIIEDAKNGKLKILYIAPERQENEKWIEATLNMKLSMVAIDEAHCISIWGHDFRPAYRRIIHLVKLLQLEIPVLAITATATKRVEEDVAKQIGDNITIVRGNLMRENLKLFVIKVNSEDEKFIWLGQNINKFDGTGIIYTGTRVNTEIYSKWLEYINVPSKPYSAGLDADSRIKIEDGFMNNKWKCVVSTNALGMGIDKPDIRFIIHTQIPQSPIHYYQEIGRAGRDGKTSYIILFYNPEDKDLPLSFIEGSKPPIKKYEQVIDLVKNELLGELEIIKQANLKKNQFRVIKADLIDQGIIREVKIGGSKKFEYVFGAPPLNTKLFQELREAKLKELDEMVRYVETDKSRMKFLCDYLGDSSKYNFKNCDNTAYEKMISVVTPEWKKKLEDFLEGYYPKLEVESKGSKIANGVASSYYGFSNVGKAIHHSKYENGGDYPDFLVDLVIKAINKNFGTERFDLILYVPPTVSRDLVKNFAMKISKKLNIPISHKLVKTRTTKEQKVFQNSLLKSDNVKGAFSYNEPLELKEKSILLIDDIFDSGATIKEIGKYLTTLGAAKITPVVIAKTVGGDLS